MADYDDVPYIVVERRTGSIAAFLWGALIGAGIALLYAPRSGRETRREIQEGARRVRRTAQETVQQVQEAVLGTIHDLRGEVDQRISSAREAFETGREAAREARARMDARIAESRSGTGRPTEPPPAAPGYDYEADDFTGEEDEGIGS